MRGRMDGLIGQLEERELDAMLISAPENRRYLSGFTGSAGYLLISKDHAVLVTDSRYTEQAASQAPDYRVIQARGSWDWLVELLKETQRRPTVLTVEEVGRLKAHASPPYDIIIFIAAHAGLRHGEILHLQVKDADLERGNITVSAKSGWTPKSHIERSVPINRHLRPVLESQTEMLEDRRAGAWLFPGPDGKALSIASGPVRAAFKNAGLRSPGQAGAPHVEANVRKRAPRSRRGYRDGSRARRLEGPSDRPAVSRFYQSEKARGRRASGLIVRRVAPWGAHEAVRPGTLMGSPIRS